MRRILTGIAAVLAMLAIGWAPTHAQDASPPATGSCAVEPYDLAGVLANAAASPAAASPAAGAAAERPTGEAADEETVAAVTGTVDQFFACLNEGYLYRYLFLFTPEYLTESLAGTASAESIDQLIEEITNEPVPTPVPEDQQTILVGIEEIQVLDDGRVVATVIGDDLTSEAGPSPVYFILEEVDGVHLIDGVIDPVAPGATPEA